MGKSASETNEIKYAHDDGIVIPEYLSVFGALKLKETRPKTMQYHIVYVRVYY